VTYEAALVQISSLLHSKRSKWQFVMTGAYEFLRLKALHMCIGRSTRRA